MYVYEVQFQKTFTELDAKDLSAASDGSEHIEEVLLPLLKKKSLSHIDVDAVLKKPDVDPMEEHVPAENSPDTTPVQDTQRDYGEVLMDLQETAVVPDEKIHQAEWSAISLASPIKEESISQDGWGEDSEWQ